MKTALPLFVWKFKHDGIENWIMLVFARFSRVRIKMSYNVNQLNISNCEDGIWL
jgi:hypothetical protein